MKIKRLFLLNFRAVGTGGLEINFGSTHTTIIGENNVGKSSILEAVKKVLNPDAKWDVEDWHGTDQDKTIEIILECSLDEEHILEIITALSLSISVSQFIESFSNVLVCELRRTIHRSYLLFKLGELSIEDSDLWIGEIDRARGHLSGSLGSVNARIRSLNNEKIIDIFKNEIDALKSSNKDTYVKFSDGSKVGNTLLAILNRSIIVIEEFREKPQDFLTDFLASATGRELASVLFNLKNGRPNLAKYFIEIKERFHHLFPDLNLDVIREKNIKILIQKEGVESTTLYLGAGVLQVLLLLTHTTSYGRHVLFMDSPESHLHPHVLRRLSAYMEVTDGGQIVIVTHSPYLINLNKNNAVHRAIQVATQTKLIECPKNYFTEDDFFKLEQFLDIDSKELFFSRKVLLVEGPTEFGALPIFADELGFNLDENGVSVINVGGKKAFEIFVKVCEAYKIPYIILADDDAFENVNKLKESYPNLKAHILSGKFEDLLPKSLRDEAMNVVGTSKPRVGRYVAKKMNKEKISPEIIYIMEQVKKIT